MVVDKHVRLYVGAGSSQGLSQQALTDQVASACGLSSGDIQRVSVRGAYSFVDVPEKVADQVVEKLGDAQVAGRGEKFFVKKAVTLSIPREPTAEELAALQSRDEAGYEGGHDDREERNGDRYDESQSEDEGPTLLAVDDQA
jgi:hypothetical protein